MRKDFNKLSVGCYIDKSIRLKKFIPEKEVKMEKYNERIWKLKFPATEGLKYEKLQLTNIGLYSISTPSISNNLIEFIADISKNHNIDIKIVTETNGGLGGFSIRLAQNFDNLNIIEINRKHADIIKNNLTVYGLSNKNIQIYNEDYLDIMYDIKSDIIICDPPWGGLMYNTQKNIRLGMDNINIVCIINEIFKHKMCKCFILLAPKNFDIQNFLTFVERKDISIRKLDKHYFIALF